MANILTVKQCSDAVRYVSIILHAHHYIFHSYDDILKHKNFDQLFEVFLREHCEYEGAVWRIEGDTIHMNVKGVHHPSSISLAFDTIRNTTILSYQVFDKMYDCGEINPLKFELSYDQELLFTVKEEKIFPTWEEIEPHVAPHADTLAEISAHAGAYECHGYLKRRMS